MPNQSVNENVGNVTFMVARSAGSSGAVSATVTLGGTANNPADYSSSSTTLNWGDGDTADKSITLTIVDDSLVETSETVTLTLGMVSGGATVGAPNAATLTIVDNDGVTGVPTPVFIPATSRWTLAMLGMLMLLVAGIAIRSARR
jgi:hypothetical protein